MQGEEKLNKYIDYLDLVKILQQFKKMKTTIFNSYQKDLFEHYSKSRVLYKNEESKDENKEIISINDKNNSISNVDYTKYNKLYDSYKNIQQKEVLSEYDERILKKFDNDLKLSFDAIYNNDC